MDRERWIERSDDPTEQITCLVQLFPNGSSSDGLWGVNNSAP